MKSDLKKISSEGGLFTPALHENPYPTYQELRDQDPVYWDEPAQAWVITRFDDVALVLKDPRFSSNRTGSASGQITQAPYRFMLDIMADKMSEKDEPDHMRLRSLVNKAFGRVAKDGDHPCSLVEETWHPLPCTKRVTSSASGRHVLRYRDSHPFARQGPHLPCRDELSHLHIAQQLLKVDS